MKELHDKFHVQAEDHGSFGVITLTPKTPLIQKIGFGLLVAVCFPFILIGLVVGRIKGKKS